jgi:hypothetical protein
MTKWKVVFGRNITADGELIGVIFFEEKAEQIVHEHNVHDGLVEALAMKLYEKFEGIHGAWEDMDEEYRKEYRAMAVGIASETEKANE